MNTYPNQKIVHIKKKEYENNFLQIGIDEWQHAAKVLSPVAFKIYLYLASNKNHYNLALSQKAIENSLNIKKTAYHDGVNELEFMGYLINKQGNIQEFTTYPQFDNADMNFRKSKQKTPQKRTNISVNSEDQVRKSGKEIDNINKINKINNNIYTENCTYGETLLEDLMKNFTISADNEVEIPDTYNPDDFPSNCDDYEISEDVMQEVESLRILKQHRDMQYDEWYYN